MTPSNIVGVDYGSKLAGTTVMTFLEEGALKSLQVNKGVDADKWLMEKIIQHGLTHVFIDAPLSLPGGFFGRGDDFSYRQSDRILRAMSPMFLGGLTARAIKLKAELTIKEIHCTEVYPGGFIRNHGNLKAFYDKKNQETLPKMYAEFSNILPYKLKDHPTNYHQLDSLICWHIGYRYLHGHAESVGDADEGLIWI
jgi:uncharacterized protein